MVSCRIVDIYDGKIMKEHPVNDKVLISRQEIKATIRRKDWKQLEEDPVAKREDSVYLLDKH